MNYWIFARIKGLFGNWKMRHKFITIEGCIGAGKTTLTKTLAEQYTAPFVLENFDDNPYLRNFYENPDRHAFSLELYFMAERYQQQKSIVSNLNLFEDLIFTDYAFFKSFIFANVTLKNEDELQLFKMLYNIIYPNIKAPDLIVYLYKPVDLLLENIEKRGRSYEKNIPAEYLNNLNQAYLDYFKQQENSTVVVVDSSNLDFVANPSNLEFFKDVLSKDFDKKLNFL